MRSARQFPKPSKQGTWQAQVETSVRVAREPELARGDIVRVTGDWQATPVGSEALLCAGLALHARAASSARRMWFAGRHRLRGEP